MDNEVAEARARLAAKFGKVGVQLGGKGTYRLSISALAGKPVFTAHFDSLGACRNSEKSPEETHSHGTGNCYRGQEDQGSYQEVW
jgi:hypothetical protein